MRGEKDVIYGIVWPVYGREAGEIDSEEKGGPVEQICEELRNAGVEDIFRHAALFDPEYCEDCGTPLYADRTGEIVHAELPEDAPRSSRCSTEPERVALLADGPPCAGRLPVPPAARLSRPPR